MPPRCFPPEPNFPDSRRAERTVWEALRDQLPDEAALFHSLPLKERDQDYEADLLVAWPGIGVAVIEVKGGQVSRDHAQWYQSDRQGRHPITSPVTQAEDCKHVLHRYLRGRGADAAQARSTHLVAFPYTDISKDWEAPGCPRDIVIDRRDTAGVAERVRRAIEEYGAGSRPLAEADLDQLVAMLEGQLSGQISLLSQAEEHEQRVSQMTRDQARILGVLRYHRRLKVIGGAGTGKTWLALEQARRLAKSGERAALVCYSRGLARYFERMTEAWPPGERPAYVGLFHALRCSGGRTRHPPTWMTSLPRATTTSGGSRRRWASSPPVCRRTRSSTR